MSSAEDRIEDPFIPGNNMSFPQHNEPAAQKRKMSHSDNIDDGTPPIHVDLNPTTSPTSNAEHIKVAYNGPATIYVVMLRISNESSARPMPQAAFFDRNKALAFATRILLQWCNAHYDDYIWKGPESLRNGLVERYAAYHAQIGQQLAVADVIRVSVFDARETEVVIKKEDKNEEKDEGAKEREDDAEHHEQSEEESEENSEDTATYSSHSTQTQKQGFGKTTAHSDQAEEPEIDLKTLSAMFAHGHRAASEQYAIELVTRLAKRSEGNAVSGTRGQGAWKEDHEMRVFGGSTE